MTRLLAFLLALTALALIASTSLAAPSPIAAGRAAPMASAHYRIEWSATGGISAGTSTSLHYSLRATISQMAANTSSASAAHKLCTGYECLAPVLRLFLPLLRRS